MAIDISDINALDSCLGDRLPIEILFRAIEERWSVVCDRLKSLPSHPLAYDRFPTSQDRLDAIRKNICALAPYFVNLDDDANQPTGWALCPKPYSVDDIARSGLDAGGRGHVLLMPERGSVWGVWESEWYHRFLKSAAYWLAKFRYVYAGPWTIAEGSCSLSFSGKWYDAPEWWKNPSALLSEGYTINGEDYMTEYLGNDVWQRCDRFGEAVSSLDTSFVIDETVSEWGIGATGIAVEESASVVASMLRVTDEDGTYLTQAEKWDWLKVTECTYGIIHMPMKVSVVNPFAYLAKLLFVYAPLSTESGERTQKTTTSCSNGNETIVWREILGNFMVARNDVNVNGVVTKAWGADYDPATGRKKVYSDETQDGDRLDKNGTDVSIDVERDNEPESFGAFHIGDGDQATDPAGLDSRIEEKSILLSGKMFSVVFHGGGNALVRPNLDPSAMLGEALGFRVENGPGENPLLPTHPGYNPIGTYSARITYAHAGCRIVPILDFGDVFKITADEEIEDLAGIHSDDEEDD